jgi:hypothetical protein
MQFRSPIAVVALAFACVLTATAARAGYDEGLAYLHAGDFMEALEELLPIANTGDARAQAEVGMIYHYGLVSAKNFAKASDYYHRAAMQENPDGMIGLSIMNALGQGVAKNMIEAYKWLVLARDRLPKGNDRDRVVGALDGYRESMTNGEIETAEWRARTWVPNLSGVERN